MTVKFDDNNVLKKASSVITATQIGDVQLHPQDRILFNYLLHRANNKTNFQIYRISSKEAMDYTRISRHSDLLEAIRRLCTIVIEIDYKDENDDARCITAHYLSADVSKSENGILEYSFCPILFHFINHPKVYAQIYMDRSRALALKSNAAIILYEIMALNYRKKSPVFRATPDELRKLLSVGNKHTRPDNFRKKVIEETVEEVNAIAEFDIIYEYVKGGKGGGIVEVIFTAVSKSHNRLIEAANVQKIKAGRRGAAIDKKTIDMYDGKTFEERGGAAILTSKSYDGARDIMPENGNIEDYISEWRSLNREKVFVDPDEAFLKWLEAKFQKEADPILQDLDMDVFGQLMNDII